MRRAILLVTTLGLLWGLLCPLQAQAQTVYVDNIDRCDGLTPCYSTITDAVAAATGGGVTTIEVFAGVYHETVSFNRHPGNVVLKAHVDALRPVIDPGVDILATPGVQLLNFVLTGGVTVTALGSRFALIEGNLIHGGISFTIVTSCTVRNNTLVGSYIAGEMSNCLIEGNRLVGGGIAAGAHTINASFNEIRRNVVRGGGIGLSGRAVGDNTIEFNFVSGSPYDGIQVEADQPGGDGNLIQFNTVIESGSGCDINDTTHTLVQNTWENNRFGTECGRATD